MSRRCGIVCERFYLLVRRGPRRATLFPYTTLFRSMTGNPWCVATTPCSSPAVCEARKATTSREQASATATRGDRKSTRLNSSHVSISYAVFCLKNKIRQVPCYFDVGHADHHGVQPR